MICANCGKNNKDSEDFCIECGAALPKITTSKTTQKAMNAYSAPAKKKANGNLVTTIVIISLSLLALIVIGIIIANVLQGDASVSRQPAKETQATSAPITELPEPEGPISKENIYYDCYYAHSDYVFTHSSDSYLTRQDLTGLNKEELTIAREEIYARHGYSFSDSNLQEYFSARSWYKTGEDSDLNTFEKTNVITLNVYIQQLSGSVSDPGNPYMNLFSSADGYTIYNSQNRYLESEDLKDLTEKELSLSRNEIYARHGYIFSDEDLQFYFSAKNWYTPVSTSIPDSNLNEFESNNVRLIQLYEEKMDGIEYDIESKYADYVYSDTGYIFPGSDSRAISTSDLADKTSDELVLGRNEIFARYGYVFEDIDLLGYFMMQDWYCPGGQIGDSSWVELTGIEKENISTIEEGETILATLPEDLTSLNTSLTNTVTYDLFSIQTPAYWADYAVHDAASKKFCEKVNKEHTADFDGFLLEFSVIPADQSLTSGNYSLVGLLTDAEGNQFALYAIYPTDVRYHALTKGLYTMMDNDIPQILGTVTPAEGYTFIAY